MSKTNVDDRTLSILEFDKIRDILASYATCSLGRSLAGQICPSADVERIRRDLEETSEMRRVLESGPLPLGGLHDIREQAKRAMGGGTPLKPQELLDINDSLMATEEVKRAIAGLGEAFQHLTAYGNRIGSFPKVREAISVCIDGRGQVSDNASPKLAKLRRTMDKVRGEIRNRIGGLIKSREFGDYLQDEMFTIRDGRHVVPVMVQHRTMVDGVFHGYSGSGATVFIEPKSVVSLGDKLRELQADEEREVIRILWRLTATVADGAAGILDTVEILAHLDFLHAKASFSRAFEMSEPSLNNEGILGLDRARHPLLMEIFARRRSEEGTGGSQDVEEVVPIDVWLGYDFNTLVITGPNMGGKTVALKTIGLLALMAQSGLHIPAEPSSRINVFGQIFADIGDEQSLEQSLSTFSSHMSRIVRVVERSDFNTLVLLDELGAGTDPAEGAALGTAILGHLDRVGVRAVVTTHLGNLKQYAHTNPRTENASVQFDPETLLPTYVLAVGTPGVSNALVIARRLGMPDPVLSEASGLLDRDDDVEIRDLIESIQRTKATIEESRRAMERDRAGVRRLRREYEAKLARLERQLEQGASEPEKLLRDLSRRIDDLTSPGRRSRAQIKTELVRLGEEIRRALGDEISRDNGVRFARGPSEREREGDTTPTLGGETSSQGLLSIGDRVYLRKFRRTAEVLQVDLRKNRALVSMGTMKMEVPFEDIAVPEGGRDHTVRPSATHSAEARNH